MMPTFPNEVTQQVISDAQAGGLPSISGKQVVGTASVAAFGRRKINWYHLEDGAEWVADDQGNAVEWPQ
jgi:hypothetical protein